MVDEQRRQPIEIDKIPHVVVFFEKRQYFMNKEYVRKRQYFMNKEYVRKRRRT